MNWKLAMVWLAVLLGTATQALSQTTSPSNGPGTNQWWTNQPPPNLTNNPSDLPPATNFPPRWTNSPRLSNFPSLPTNLPPVWTNQPPVGTNYPAAWTNLPPAWTNRPPAAAGSSSIFSNSPTSLTPPTHSLPTNVQSIVQQFRTQRAQLISELQSAGDASQRAAVLQQLETLREQLQQELQTIAQTARDQAIQMRGEFNNPLRPGLQGGGGGSTTGSGGNGHGGPGRP